MPGLRIEDGRIIIDRNASHYPTELAAFYEEYLSVAEGTADLDESRFVLDDARARGFTTMMERLRDGACSPLAVKGQVTGPITFCTGVHDEQNAAIFYDEQLRDAGVKLLAMKARWQIRRLSAFKRPVMIFCDEPALAGYGTSEFISISREDILTCLREVVEAIHDEGGLAGVHVCANTDWSLVLDTAADIISFDAYEYFDRFALYREQIVRFMDAGNILAWGIVPTHNDETVSRETAKSLLEQWHAKAGVLEQMGIKRSTIRDQSLITPSCGAGSLSPESAIKVLQLTREVSDQLRKTFGKGDRNGN
jgi:methionine synthase II (cobalamin-independent)